MEKKCLYCSESFKGRKDKLFCTSYCKSAYHYQNNQIKEDSLFKQIDKKLKKNRKLLKRYNQAGKVTIRKEKLISEGFDPAYFTHYWKNQKGQVYLFCYEYGFLKINENIREKYVLVKWQDYMKAGS